jgi:hypothetical protein
MGASILEIIANNKAITNGPSIFYFLLLALTWFLLFTFVFHFTILFSLFTFGFAWLLNITFVSYFPFFSLVSCS